MSSRVVPVRLDQETLESIDLLVELGVFKSRSEAVRALVKIGIEELNDLAVIVDACEKLFELERRLGDIPIRFRGGFKELIEMRERSY